MERKFTLICCFLLGICLFVFAAAPTVSPSNLEYTSVDGDRMTIRFQKGNGAFRIVVMKEGAPITTLPVNGADYNANGSFGTTGTAFNGNDGFVVYDNSSASNLISVAVTNLKPATTYYIAVFEYNGSGAATEYNMVALTGSKATVSAPTTQGSFKPVTNIIGNSLQLNWNNGNGARRLILARRGSPVNATPADLTSYLANDDMGAGAVINGDNYVVYSGTSNTLATISLLEPNTIYHFALFEYNGSSSPVYLAPGATISAVTNAGPTRASGPITFPTVDGNRMTINFSRGNGKHQLIIGRKGQAVTALPQNGEIYQASPVFGSGFEIAEGQFVLNAEGVNRSFTNLDPYSVYHFRVYEYDIDANGNTYYLTNLYSQNSSSTALPPVNQVSGITFENVTGTSATIKYTPGDSKYRLIVMKAGSEVDAVPADLIKYSGNPNFGQGNVITAGNYIIQGSTNSTVANVSMLTPGVTYHVAIWGWNGLDYPIYKQDPARKVLVIPNEPSAPGTDWRTSSVEGNSFFCTWSGGEGARKLVIARKGQAVTARPVDGETYDASTNFGDGEAIEDGQFVVHDGTARGFTIDKLEAGSTYHFAVFEYNVTNGLPDYQAVNFLPGTGTTLAAPASPTVSLNADDIQANSVSLSLVKGNGANRLIVMRANAPVSAEPVDFQSYSWSGVFGTSGSHMGNGNYVVGTPSGNGPVTVSGLTPNTVYHVAAFEYNGTSRPVFLRPATVYQFTTTTGGGVVAPTVPSSNPSFIVDGNKLTFNWNQGDGAKRIVVMKQGSAVSFSPSDGANYEAATAFGTGADLGDGQYVVYNGSQQSVIITNLQPAVTYHLAIFEYNGTGATIKYLKTEMLVVQQSTASAPVSGSTGISANAGATSVTLNWQKGTGDARLVVMKEGGMINGEPANLGKYSPSNVFKNGAQIATGEFAIYSSTGNSVTVTGLDPQKTYHFSVFEYNGADAPVYNVVNVLRGQATTTGALPLTWLYFNVKEKPGRVDLSWGTADEVNTAYFVIERSKADGVFVELGREQAKNTLGNHDYSFTDFAVPAVLVQYRIKQLDLDGKYTYSQVIALNRPGASTGINLYPNPAVESFRIILPAGTNRAQLMIYDMSGKQVLRRIVVNNEMIPLSQLSKGSHYVVIEDGLKKYTERLLKQ